MLKKLFFSALWFATMQNSASAQVDWASWWRTHPAEQNCVTLALSEITNDGSRQEADLRAFEAANWWANRAVAAGQGEATADVLASLIRRSSVVGAALEESTDPEVVLLARGLRPIASEMKRACNATARASGGPVW